jgi:hypothetical protein
MEASTKQDPVERARLTPGTRVALAALTVIAFGVAILAPAGSAAAPPSTAPVPGGAAHPGPAAGGPAPGGPGGHMAQGQPQAAPEDVASPDALLKSFYAAISGPAGKKRDWNRFLSLFFPGARLLPAEGRGHAGVMPEVFSPSSYLYDTEPYMLQAGYIVRETARRSESFGKIAQVFSTYAVRHAEGDAKPFVRGINSFQLFFDGSRWWIFSLAWQPETPRLALPPQVQR